jgi:hypothetical protein
MVPAGVWMAAVEAAWVALPRRAAPAVGGASGRMAPEAE